MGWREKFNEDELKALDFLFGSMCEVVGVDYNTIDPTKKEWYKEHTWTEQQFDTYREWLINVMYKNQKELVRPIANMKKSRYTKKEVTKLVDEWLLDYGWKIKNEEDN